MEDLHGRASATATYPEIKAYVLEKFGLKVSSLYIAQIKEKCGLDKRENFNIGEGKSRPLICPPEKEQAIMDAFRHFGMIDTSFLCFFWMNSIFLKCLKQGLSPLL